MPTVVNAAPCFHFCHLVSGPEHRWTWLRLHSYSHLTIKNEDDGEETPSPGPTRGAEEEGHIYGPFSSFPLRPPTAVTLTSARPDFLSYPWPKPPPGGSPAELLSLCMPSRVCLLACVVPGSDDRNETPPVMGLSPSSPILVFP